jgi:hypothetical protein
MKLPIRSRKTGRSPTAIDRIRLYTLRLTSLFQNTREFFNLLDDGKEKSSGEYILDFHYVFSLVDRTVTQMNNIIHDACILEPQGGDNLYSQLDACTRQARERFIETDRNIVVDPDPSAEGSAIADEPEYVLLSQALKWLNNKETGTDPTFLNLLDDVFDHVFQQKFLNKIPWKKLPRVELDTADARNIVSIIDLDNFRENVTVSTLAVDDLESRPFGLMALGAGAEAPEDETENRPVKKWLAASRSDSLYMVPVEPDAGVLVAVDLDDETETNFVFVLCGEKVAANKLLPSGFRDEKTRFGSMACVYDAPAGELDDYLAQLGKSLFSTS